MFDIVGQYPRDRATTIARGMKLVCLTLQMHDVSRIRSRVEKRFVLHLPFIPQYFVRAVSILHIQLYWILDGNSTKRALAIRLYERSRFLSCYMCAYQ